MSFQKLPKSFIRCRRQLTKIHLLTNYEKKFFFFFVFPFLETFITIITFTSTSLLFKAVIVMDKWEAMRLGMKTLFCWKSQAWFSVPFENLFTSRLTNRRCFVQFSAHLIAWWNSFEDFKNNEMINADTKISRSSKNIVGMKKKIRREKLNYNSNIFQNKSERVGD